MSVDHKDIQDARDRFAAWLRWYRDNHADEVPSDKALAKAIGVSPAAVSYLLRAGAKRTPNFKTLLAARALVGRDLEVLLGLPPLPPAVAEVGPIAVSPPGAQSRRRKGGERG